MRLYRGGEGGQITAFVAVFAVALFVLAGLVVDGGLALSAKTAALNEAEQAARAGAAALSRSALRQGTLGLDPVAAVRTAQASMAAAGHPGRAWVAGHIVTAEVGPYEHPTFLLGLVGFDHFSIGASASATDVAGIVQEVRP
ncbi:MAG: pilus assembly protein TadG-related protein [Acidimicrobiales bacterium]